jgi:single-strand DNA-binding protein
MAENLRIPAINRIMIVGRATKDVELRYTSSNLAVVSVNIASNRSYKDSKTGEWKDDPTFVSVVIFGEQAERANEKLKKGSPVYVEGRLQSRKWETNQGEKRSTLEIICDKIQFLTKAEALDATKTEIEPKGTNSTKTVDTAWDVEENIENLDEEIPF